MIHNSVPRHAAGQFLILRRILPEEAELRHHLYHSVFTHNTHRHPILFRYRRYVKLKLKAGVTQYLYWFSRGYPGRSNRSLTSRVCCSHRFGADYTREDTNCFKILVALIP